MSEVLSLYRGVIRQPEPLPTMRQLLIETAMDWGLSTEDLRSFSRAHAIVHPRQDFMWRARQVKFPNGEHRFSLPMIGRFLGGMDHTTVKHGVAAHAKRTQNARGAA